MKKLENKIAIVTGGTTGIGLATAKLFAAEGAKVTVTGSNPKTIEAARAELRGIAEVVQSDAGSPEEIAKLAASFAPGGADIVFLNAGVAKFGPIAQLEAADFEKSLRVNVIGPWLAIKHFAPVLRRGGAIVINGSVNADLGMPGSSVYAATKAAARSLVRTAASELAESGIRVNSVTPGPIETPLYGKLGFTPEMLQGFADSLTSKIPLKRFGKPEEIARVVLFLASEDSSYITGEEVVVDGGMTRV